MNIMENITLFKNHSAKVKNMLLLDILNQIKSGNYKMEIDKIRELISEEKYEEANMLKSKLLAFTPSGTFDNRRKCEQLSSYSGYIILDFDKLTPNELNTGIEKAVSLPYTFALFISPRGNGLKIIVPVDSTAENHKRAMLQVSDYYKSALNLSLDESGSDLARLCYVSYDPECYINPGATRFPVHIDNVSSKISPFELSEHMPTAVTLTSQSSPILCWLKVFSDCVSFTDKTEVYGDGSRNNYIFQLACNCNRKGIPVDVTEGLIHQYYDLDKSEISSTVNSAYESNLKEHAKYAKHANVIGETETPFLPDSIFEKLPTILKDGCDVFHMKRERDVFLTGALAILSGCMWNVFGLYDGKEYNANLYVLIVSPPASGKGALTYAKELAQGIHNKIYKESQLARRKYKADMQLLKKGMQEKNADFDGIEEPPVRLLYIPANSSSARVYQHLFNGNSRGIICDTEADTLNNVFKQEWGGYSDVLRKCFHHETIAFSRKKDDEYLEIEYPCLSLALSGTPRQADGFVQSVEDGLYSRCLHYVFKANIEWKNVGENNNGINLTAHFKSLSVRVEAFNQFLLGFPRVEFKLSQSQWIQLNAFGENSLFNNVMFVSEELAGTSKRLCLILYRIAMVLTALRHYDNGEHTTVLYCSDEDFEIALELIKVYERHSLFMFESLPKKTSLKVRAHLNFFNKLPDGFCRKEAVDIALENGIKERTADLYLSKLEELKLLEKPKSGYYLKVAK